MPSTNAGQLTDELLRKLRDPSAIGMTREFVRDILSKCQWCINGAYRKTKQTATLTTNPNQMFYPIAAVASDVLRIEYVREGTRDLRKTTLRELGHISTKWFRHVGERFQHFALPGRDLLVVYPAKSVGSSVEVVYTKLTTVLDADSVDVELPDDDMIEASDLAQLLLLIKMREFSMLDPLLTQFTERNKVILANESK